MAAPPPPSFLLRVVISCRTLHANVTNLSTNAIVAMASTNESEFLPLYRDAKLNRKGKRFIDNKISSKIGGKLGGRLRDIGVQEVEIVPYEVKMKPLFLQKVMHGFFASVEEAGVKVVGAEELKEAE